MTRSLLSTTMGLKGIGGKMDFLRLYLGEITSVLLVVALLFLAAAIVARYVTNRRLVNVVRNICLALTLAGFAASLAMSVMVNQTPKGHVHRSRVDGDQRAFEKRVADQGK
jgi:threonine/homoserine/homoserine lactone efflux protein